MTYRSRRGAAAVVFLAALAVASLLALPAAIPFDPAPLGAQPPETTTPPAASTVEREPSGVRIETPDIIPQPGGGVAPSDPGEPGGLWQAGLFYAVCGAIVLLFLLVWRDSRRKRRAQGRLPVPR